MTGFLRPPKQPTPPSPGPPTSFGDRFGAAWERESIMTDAWHTRYRAKVEILSDLSESITGDPDAWWKTQDDSRLEPPRPNPQNVDRLAQGWLDALPRESDPQRYKNAPENFDALMGLVDAEQKRQLDEANAVLGRAPGGAFGAETLGAMARASTDEAGVAAAVAGFGLGQAAAVPGRAALSIFRTALVEGTLNAGAEAMTLPKQIEMAEQLDQPEPNPWFQLSIAAGGGAILGGGLQGLAEGLKLALPDRMMQARAEKHAGDPAGVVAAGQAVQAGEPRLLPDSPRATPPSRNRDGLDVMGSDFDRVADAVVWQESRGARYRKDGTVITSPKGAIGEWQVMPATARSPGYGIAPARLDDLDDVARLGREYLQAMLREADGDLDVALAGYNWGMGRAKKWAARGKNMDELPAETRAYIKAIRGRLELGPAGGLGFDAAPRRFHHADIKELPEIYQWKTGGPRTGVLRGELFSDEKAGAILVHERTDGTLYVADGHERLAQARESDAALYGVVLREADGWTEEAVIARAGIVDYLDGLSDPEGMVRTLARRQATEAVRKREPSLFGRKVGANAERRRERMVRQETDAIMEAQPSAVPRREDAPIAQGVEAATGPDAAAVFRDAARDLPNASLGTIVADIADHVRGRLPAGARRGAGDQVGIRDRQGAAEGVSPEALKEFAEPHGEAVTIAADEGLRSARLAVETDGDFEVQVDGGTARASEVIADLDRDADFMGALDACPTGKTKVAA